MGFNMKKPSMAISYGGESNKQQKKNLMTKDPVAEHASGLNNLNKGYGASDSMAKMNGSPFQLIKSKPPKKKKPATGSLSVDNDKIIPDLTLKGGPSEDDKAKSQSLVSGSKPDTKPSKSSSSKTTAPKYKSGSEGRKAEYDAKGWKYDDTIKGYNRDGSSKETSVKPAAKGVGKTAKQDGPKTKVAKEDLKTAKVEAKTGQADRKDTRKSKRISKRANRVSKREDIRKSRAQAKADGLTGKAKRTAIKTAKTAAKKKQAEANK